MSYRLLFLLSALVLCALVAACGGDDSDTSAPTPAQTAPGALTVTEWADQVCALAVEAADALDTPPAASGLTLEERKQRAAEVLAPRADTLANTADLIQALHPPLSAAAFNSTLHNTMRDVAEAWHTLVDSATEAQSDADLDAANQPFIDAQDNSDAEVGRAFDALDAEVLAALAAPADCGILNNIR